MEGVFLCIGTDIDTDKIRSRLNRRNRRHDLAAFEHRTDRIETRSEDTYTYIYIYTPR